MEGIDFGWLMGAMAEPWPQPASSAPGSDKPPEFRSDLGEDAYPSKRAAARSYGVSMS